MNEALLRRLLEGSCADLRVLTLPETGSTNTEAGRLFREGAREPVLVTADRQTGGRGRCGKTFLSPEGGLYFSLLLPGDRPLTDAVGVTSCAAVAVRRAILHTTGADCGVKWVNDLYLGGRKLCGILCESVNDYETMTSRALIVGVGINLKTAPAIADSEVRAVSLAEAGFSAEPETLCAEAVRELLDAARGGFSFADCADEYRSASLVIGREITYEKNGVCRRGTAEGIDEKGGLIVRSDGGRTVLDSGEIHVRL